MQHLLWKFGVSRRRRDGCAVWDHPGSVSAEVIGVEGRSDSAGEPIEADVGEHLVAGEDAFDIASAIRPGAEFLHDPCRKPGWRIVEGKAQGLWPRALNRRVGGVLFEPMVDLVDKDLLLRSWILDPVRLAAHGQKIDMNADQLVRMRVAHAR